jgi:hypothetical protein
MKYSVNYVQASFFFLLIFAVATSWYFIWPKEEALPIAPTIETEIVASSSVAVSENESVTADPTCVLLDNFSNSSQLSWFTVNDGVMGGLSDGSVSIVDGILIHEGVLNTNGGGFSYAGTRLPDKALAGYSRLEIRLNTNGRQYAVNFGDTRNRRISHQILLPIGPLDEWQEVSVNFADTVPTIFSRPVNSAPFEASAIDDLSFILGDGLDGPFRMEVGWIKVCS